MPDRSRPHHWSIVTHWEDGSETNDGVHIDSQPRPWEAEQTARAWARKQLRLTGVTGVMLVLWSAEPAILRRVQVYPEREVSG